MSRVEVVPHDPEWANHFARIHAHIWPVVQHASMRLEHVGSTAVPGLPAKPVIDACIVVASRRDIPYVVKALATLGYVHRGDLGVPDREAFRAPISDHPDALPKHHLYASPRHSLSLRNQLGLRDALRTQPALAAEYGALKQELARQFPTDIDRYIAGKTDFIIAVLREKGFTDDEVAVVRGINQRDPV